MGRRFSTATGQALSGEFQINTTTANDQYRPRMVTLADGTFLVAWHSYAQDGSGWGVFGQRIQANGTKLGGEFRMNSQTASDQFRVEMAALQDGGFVAVWESQGQDGSAGGVYAQRYAIQSGMNQPQAVGSEFLVAQVTAGDQGYPTVSALPDGGYAVSWQSNASGQYQVQSRNFAGAMSPRWIAGTTAGDTLTGFGGADTLFGGLGSDTLTGGTGADMFLFSDPNQGTDTITDFKSGIDRIEIVGSAFGGLPAGQLDAGRLAFNASGDADDRFVFNATTGALSYDPDGNAQWLRPRLPC